MKNLKPLLVAFAISLLFGCKAEKIDADKVISNIYISNKTPRADGAAIVDVSVQLSKDADDDKRSVIFHTTGGTFVGSKDTIITQKAEFINGNLSAYVKLLVPNNPGTIYITARPLVLTKYNEFVLTGSLTSVNVRAKTITLSASAVGVSAGFTGEVLITGLLKNEGNVSADNNVIFEDVLASGAPANGRFRVTKSSTDANSSVSTYYSPGNMAVGDDVYIKCTLLDGSENKTDIQSTIKIAIIPHG
jgi:hypothetical protein